MTIGEDGYASASTVIRNMAAGSYTVEEDEGVLRYILTDAWADTNNITVQKQVVEEVNQLKKITASVTADLTLADGELTYTNEKVMHDQLSDNAVVVNEFQ